MHVFVLAILILIDMITVFLYARKLNELVKYSSKNNLDIFNFKYRDIYHLTSDQGFLFRVIRNKYIDATDNLEQKRKLSSVRFLLRMQGILMLFMFLIVAYHLIFFK